MMAFCRTALIDRLLSNDKCNGCANVSVPRTWNDVDSFERDNIAEVYRKLVNIEEQIWAKLIVMERNVRSAKAYLRSRTVTADGTQIEFDGFRIGLKHFENAYRDEGTRNSFQKLGRGVRMRIDDAGNIWMRCIDGTVYVNCILGDLVVKTSPIKVFDLKIFKDFISRSADFDEVSRDRFSRLAIVYIHVEDPTDPLSSPLWLAIIHLAALEMIQILLPNSSGSNTSTSSTSAEVRSGEEIFSRPTSIAEDNNNVAIDSSESSSHYAILNCVQWNRQARRRGGAFKRINRDNNLNTSSTHAKPNPSSNVQKECRGKGRSLLDLSDLDRLRNPAYFPSERSNRGGTGHCRLSVSSNPRNPEIGSSKWRTRSETSLYCERL